MRIEKMKMEDLRPADYNPRKMSEKELDKLKMSIEEFGYVDLVIWNETTGNIVGGHQRYKALEDLGFEEIDVVVLEMDESKEKALNIALNKISGEFDIEKLKEILSELQFEDIDLELTGFDLEEVENMLTGTSQSLANGGEVDLEDFDDDDFNCRCPKCDFHFNA